ncbi:MAG: hypothetical protein C0483_19065 [Pirellula sp.]|nr:hypothetical protein [Pirellula sp.]
MSRLGKVAAMNTLVTFNPVTVGPNDTLAHVLRLMGEYEMHHVPVVGDDFQLLGILSDMDVSRYMTEQPSGVEGAGWDDACGLPAAGVLMTRDVASVDEEFAPLVALQTMLKRHVHSIPVTSQGRLRGIITSRDFLREFAEHAPRTARCPVAKIMSAWRPTIRHDAAPQEAIELLELHQTRYLGVTDGVRAIGVLSQRQLGGARRLELVGEDDSSDNLMIENTSNSVGSLLPQNHAVIEPLRTLADAAAHLAAGKSDGLAVVEPSGKVVGMLTATDLLRAMSLELARHA